MHTGSCLCGDVRFEIDGDLTPPSACHCGQCRRQSGHVWASTHIPNDRFRLTNNVGLRWFQASDIARRGFCGHCGSFLFWDPKDEDAISVSMGVLDAPTDTTLARHIFVADKGDYYDLNDGLPQSDQ
ncbi:GFA family protein [Phaeobacter marinintestinus]|uniref:GFA family protein n=1 Tax=Falsiphaeobacter marinintestinus TaxID=1492905 RepID=UPI00164534A1|nr:GFA family protein [Phaeobacter marinintestinus]